MSWWKKALSNDIIGDIPADILATTLQEISQTFQDQGKSRPTLIETLDAIKLAVENNLAELLFIEQDFSIDRLVAKLEDQPDVISSNYPNSTSQQLANTFISAFKRISEEYLEALDRKPRLTELLACINFVLPFPEQYLLVDTDIILEEIVAELSAKSYIENDMTNIPINNLGNERKLDETDASKVIHDKSILSISIFGNEPGFIIILNAPLEALEEPLWLDFGLYDIEDDFLGFRLVPPGIHYVAVADMSISGSWCYLQPKQVIVKELKYSPSKPGFVFQDVSKETATHYQELLFNGTLEQSLISYHIFAGNTKPWQKITQHILPNNFPPVIHNENLNSFVKQVLQTRQDEYVLAFLSEFEFSFISWFAERKEESMNHWCQMLQAIYNADSYDVKLASKIIIELVDIFMVQLNFVSPEDLLFYNLILSRSERLIENMINSNIKDLIEKGQELMKYLDRLNHENI